MSTRHDSLFRFHRWLTNLRVLEIEEVKFVPYASDLHQFVERLIGTNGHEYLDRIIHWNAIEFFRKMDDFRACYDAIQALYSLYRFTPAASAGELSPTPTRFDSNARNECFCGLIQATTPT